MSYEQLAPALLLAKAKELARRYRESVAELVAVIAEIDRRKAYTEASRFSTFEFCVKDLGLSEDDAFKMIRSARAATDRPEVLSFLAEGSLTARTVALLAPDKREPDFVELLDRARGRTVNEVERIMAERRPEPAIADRVRALGTPAPAGSHEPMLYSFQFSADQELKRLLGRLRDVLSHKYPKGRFEDILKEALRDYLGRHAPLLTKPIDEGPIKNPRARRAAPSIRDQVWKRDGGRCTFVNAEGKRCEATRWLEVDHVKPWAFGGRSDDPANLRLLCRAHNQAEARRLFGDSARPGGGVQQPLPGFPQAGPPGVLIGEPSAEQADGQVERLEDGDDAP